MYRARQPDAGSTHVLEATIVASIMVSAVAFVVSFETPEPVTFQARESLETKAQDALDILYDTPVEHKFGEDALSAYIGACLNEKCEELRQSLEKLVPAGASYALYLSNGYDTYPVLVNGTPGGETVSASRTFEPDWSSTFLATATESIGADDALLVYALPIYRGTPVTPGGSQLLVKVIGSRADGSDYVLLAHAATLAQSLTDLDAVGASLYFVHDDGSVLPVYDMRASMNAPPTLRLRLEESQGGWIPVGTKLDVHMPRGWTASADPLLNPDWTILAQASDANGAATGSTLKAELVRALHADGASDQADLVFDATYEGDVLDYYPIVATLSQGATATASILLQADEHSADPPLATPAVYLGVPSPMGRGAATTWTLAAHIPVSDDSTPEELSQVVTVTDVEIIEQEGNRIFGDVSALPAETMGGQWTAHGDRLRWKGEVELHLHNTLNLTFRVEASGTPGPSEARSRFLPPVEFDEWTGRLVTSTGWGFYRQTILPEDASYQGYDPEAGPLGIMHPLASNGVYRHTELPGEIQYNVSVLGAVQDSLYGSYVNAQRRSVHLGEDISIDTNVQSLLFALAEAGQRAGVTLRFYPPWTGNERVPIYEQENLDQGLLSGEVVHIVTLDVNADGYPDPIVGTNNGRVIAYHGLTGQRLQGNIFTANITNSDIQQAVPRITALETVRYPNDGDYIIVGTDGASEGLYVLNTSFGIRWKYTFPSGGQGDTLAVNASTDFDGDGRPEIVAVRSFQSVEEGNTALTYVLSAPTAITKRDLETRILPDPEVDDDAQAFAQTAGTPTTVLAQRAVGPAGAGAGILVPIQSSFEPGLEYDTQAGTLTQGSASLPRAGLQAYDASGRPTSTAFGMPATVLRDLDYDHDASRDVLVGGSSGYVTLANGSVLTQPIYSYVTAGGSKFIGADTVSSAESYALTSTGEVVMTDDAWVTRFGPTTAAVGANAIATDGVKSYWIVGAQNKIWRDGLAGELEVVQPLDLVPTYSWATSLHDFRTVEFAGDRGYIAGTVPLCIPIPPLASCGEPILLATEDGGETWSRLSHGGGALRGWDGLPLDRNITRVKVNADGTGWLVGDGGLIARNLTGSNVWVALDTPFTYDLKDIACRPNDLSDCMVVGESGAAFRITDARTSPSYQNLTGLRGLPADRDLNAVGFPDAKRGYIGSHNMVLQSFLEADWSELPLNYLENDAFVVSTPGDGTGFVFGGSDANGRIWLLHDHHFTSYATTRSFAASFEPGSHLTWVTLVGGDVTIAQQKIVVEVKDGTSDWIEFAPLAPDLLDARKPVVQSVAWPVGFTTDTDLRFRITLTTDGDKTVLSPHVRELQFNVGYLKPTGTGGYDLVSKPITLDFGSIADADIAATTADWNTTIGALRQPLVNESWTRNVRGGVLDLQTGVSILGDAHPEVWVATGDIIAENSPDHMIYAGSDPTEVVGAHDRVYLLNGLNGHPEAVSAELAGEVRQIRLALDAQGVPVTLWAATWDTDPAEPAPKGRLYALDPVTLSTRFELDLGRETPSDLEVGRFDGGHQAAFVGSVRPVGDTEGAPHLWGVDEVLERDVWCIIPDDLGKYFITTKIKPSWFYGPYVVEIEVEWDDSLDSEELVSLGFSPPAGQPAPEAQTVLRSARFYDHFMVVPPDAEAVASPLYTARLLVWMRDWG